MFYVRDLTRIGLAVMPLFFLSSAYAVYTDPKQIVQVNGKSLTANTFSYLSGASSYTSGLYNIIISSNVLDDVVFSQFDTLLLAGNITLNSNVSIVAGNGGNGGNGNLYLHGGGGGGGATFGGDARNAAIGGIGTNNTSNSSGIGIGGICGIQGGNGGNGGNGAAGGGGGFAFGTNQSCGGGQGGGNIIGGSGAGAASSKQKVGLAGEGGGQSGKITQTDGHNGENGNSSINSFGGSAIATTPAAKVYYAGGGAAQLIININNYTFKVNPILGRGGAVGFGSAADVITEGSVIGGNGGGGKGNSTVIDFQTQTNGSGGIGGGGGAGLSSSDGSLMPGGAPRASYSISGIKYSGGKGGSVDSSFQAQDLSGSGVGGIAFGSGGAGNGASGIACAGGGQGGGFGVGGGAGGLAFDVSSPQVPYLAFGGGGGGGIGAKGAQGWGKSGSIGSGNGGDGGQISVVNLLVPKSFTGTQAIGLSGGNGGSGYGGGGGGNGGGTLTIGSGQALTVNQGASLTIYGGLDGSKGSGDYGGLGGFGGGILNIGDPSTGNGSLIVNEGASLNIYAPESNASANGGVLNIYQGSTLTLNGTLRLHGNVTSNNNGKIDFGDNSSIEITSNRIDNIASTLFISDTPLNMLTLNVLNDDLTGVGIIPSKNWIIESTVNDPALGQTASQLSSMNNKVENVIVANGAYLFATSTNPLRIESFQTLTLNEGSFFVSNYDTHIYGTFIADKASIIQDNVSKFYVYGMFNTNQHTMTRINVNWLEDNSTLTTTENFDAFDHLSNKSITWNIEGTNNTASGLPSAVSLNLGSTLIYSGSNNESTTLSGTGLFKHRGTGTLTVTGSSPDLDVGGPIVIEGNYGGSSAVNVTVQPQGVLTVDTGASLNTSSLTFYVDYANGGLKIGEMILNGSATLPSTLNIHYNENGDFTSLTNGFFIGTIIQNVDNVNSGSYSPNIISNYEFFKDGYVYQFNTYVDNGNLNLILSSYLADVTLLKLGPLQTESGYYVLKDQDIPNAAFLISGVNILNEYRVDANGNILGTSDDFYTVKGAVEESAGVHNYPFGLVVGKDDSLTFEAGVTATGKVISVNGGGFTINGGSDVVTNVTNILNVTSGTFNMNGYVNLRGNTTIKEGATFNLNANTHITQDSGSTLSVSGDQSFSNVTINGGTVALSGGDFEMSMATLPSVSQTSSVFEYTGSNTFDSYTMGSHGTTEDSYNVLLMMPGSSLNVTNTLTLNNKNVLIFGYDPSSITPSNKPVLTYGNMTGGTPSDSGLFDYVFTLQLNPDGTSAGILYPSDATINVKSTTYGFNVVQTGTGIEFKINSNATSSAGSNVDHLIDDILASNNVLNRVLNFKKDESSYLFRAPQVDGPTEDFIGHTGPVFQVSAEEIIPTVAFVNNPDGTKTEYRVDANGNILDKDNNKVDDFYNVKGTEKEQAGVHNYPFGLIVGQDDFLTLEAGVTATGKEISVIDNGKFTINGGSDAVTNVTNILNDINVTSGTFNMNGYVNLRGNTTIKEGATFNLNANTHITQDSGSTLSVSGDQSFSNVTINGGTVALSRGAYQLSNVTMPSVMQDPSIFQMSGINTFDSYTMGSHGTTEDSYNVLLMMPGSSLNVTNTLTLNNKNVLIFGYDPSSITPSNKPVLTYGNMTGGTPSDSGLFDYVLTLQLNPDGTSAGILCPSDATINAEFTTFGFNVVQTPNGVQLEIKSDVEPSSGTNMDGVIQEILASNPSFKGMVKFNPVDSSYTYRSNLLVNALIGGIGGGGGSTSTVVSNDEFRFKGFNDNQSTEFRLQNVVEQMGRQGPMVKETKNYKYWHSPFVRFSRERAQTSSSESVYGILFGCEYKSSYLPYTVGLLGGFNFSKESFSSGTIKLINSKGVNFGVYGSYGAWEGGRIDALYIRALNATNSDETTSGQLVNNKYQVVDDIIDIKISHLIKIAQNVWSVRFDLGNTYSNSKTNYPLSYMRSLPMNTRRNFLTRTNEIYGGLGLRFNHKTKDYRIRVTGVYEYGYQYQSVNKNWIGGHGPYRSEEVSGDKNKTHYVTLYSSYDATEQWKFVGGYQGSFTKNTVETQFFVKAVFRF